MGAATAMASNHSAFSLEGEERRLIEQGGVNPHGDRSPRDARGRCVRHWRFQQSALLEMSAQCDSTPECTRCQRAMKDRKQAPRRASPSGAGGLTQTFDPSKNYIQVAPVDGPPRVSEIGDIGPNDFETFYLGNGRRNAYTRVH